MHRALALVAAGVAAAALTAAAVAIPNRGGGTGTSPRSDAALKARAAALKARAAAQQARAEARMQAVAERAARAHAAKMKRCHRDLAATDV
jgi:hypothetical protein